MAGGTPMRVGLVGCGNISDIYLQNGPRFRDIVFTACADLSADAANRQAGVYAIQARSVEELLKSDDVDIVLNLTVPEAHAAVSVQTLEAGKHVYSEKPLATAVANGEAIVAAAKASGLRVGAAPDTVLGAAVEEARALVDAGAIGKPLMELAAVMSHGMEHWHPNPGFFFRPGAGPVFGMGPYYLSALVALLGPVASVQATAKISFEERIVTTPGSPAQRQTIKVETLINVHTLLDFASGAHVTFLASWDVWKHGVPPIELHGQKASLSRLREKLAVNLMRATPAMRRARAVPSRSEGKRPYTSISLNGRVIAVDFNSGRQLHYIGEIRGQAERRRFVLASVENRVFTPLEPELQKLLFYLDGCPTPDDVAKEELVKKIDSRLGFSSPE